MQDIKNAAVPYNTVGLLELRLDAFLIVQSAV